MPTYKSIEDRVYPTLGVTLKANQTIELDEVVEIAGLVETNTKTKPSTNQKEGVTTNGITKE